MKKTALTATALLMVLALASCGQNRIKPIENDESSCRKIEGQWRYATREVSSVFADPVYMDQELGTLTSVTSTTLTFNPDLTFSLETSRKLESFTSLFEESQYTEEQLAENVNFTLVILGSFRANESHVQLTNENVRLSDGTVLTAKEYSKIDPNVGTAIIDTLWKVQDEVLSLTDSATEASVEYRKVK